MGVGGGSFFKKRANSNRNKSNEGKGEKSSIIPMTPILRPMYQNPGLILPLSSGTAVLGDDTFEMHCTFPVAL